MFQGFRRMRYRPTAGAAASHAVIGAVAGVAATWVMARATSWLYARQPDAVRRREDQVRGGAAAYEIAADKAAHALAKRGLSDDERQRYGQVIHYGLGATAGAVYGAMYALYPRSSWRRGLLFGAGFFLLADELANTALGLTPDPRAFPWQAHARGLAGHLVYGLTTDVALRAVERPALRAVGLRRHVTP